MGGLARAVKAAGLIGPTGPVSDFCKLTVDGGFLTRGTHMVDATAFPLPQYFLKNLYWQIAGGHSS
jgi:hypothetical protein